MSTPDRADIKAIRAALSALPARCRYHGNRTDPPDSLIRREACCDTGIPARRRALAEAALDRVTQASTP